MSDPVEAASVAAADIVDLYDRAKVGTKVVVRN